MNTTITSFKKNTFENVEDDFVPQNNVEDDFVPQNNEEDNESKIEMPPQRDLRDTQPTISVNYRVVKNMDNNLKKEQNYSNSLNNEDDWVNDDNDW